LNYHHLQSAAATRLFGLFLLFLLPFPGHAADGRFVVSELRTQLVDGQYLMDASIDYRFSDTAQEALHNGVPLTLEVHVQLRRKGAWIWEEDVLEIKLRYQLRYQALAELYQVTDLQSNSQQSFATQAAALSALGHLRGVALIKQADLEKGKTYRLSVKTALDIEALPLPLRPTAYLTPSWNLASEWKEWLLRP